MLLELILSCSVSSHTHTHVEFDRLTHIYQYQQEHCYFGSPPFLIPVLYFSLTQTYLKTLLRLTTSLSFYHISFLLKNIIIFSLIFVLASLLSLALSSLNYTHAKSVLPVIVPSLFLCVESVCSFKSLLFSLTDFVCACACVYSLFCGVYVCVRVFLRRCLTFAATARRS